MSGLLNLVCFTIQSLFLLQHFQRLSREEHILEQLVYGQTLLYCLPTLRCSIHSSFNHCENVTEIIVLEALN